MHSVIKCSLLVFTILLLVFSTSTLADINTGLIAYYNFDDSTATDVTGNGYDGILDDDPEFIDANCGAAWMPDGINDEIEITGNLDDLMFANQSMSFSIWLQVTDNVNQSRVYVYLGRDATISNNSEMFLAKDRSGNNSGRIYMCVAHHGGYLSEAFSILSGEDLPKNTWMHVVGVVDYEEQDVRLYINGEFQDNSGGLVDYDLSTGNSDFRAHIGAYEHNYFQNGPMDEVRIYNYALGEVEIQELYEECNQSIPVTGSAFGIVAANGIDLNGVPVDLVNIDGTAYASTVTDGSGFYNFEEIPNGDYLVEIQIPLGYTPVSDQSIPITIEGNDIEVNFSLEENPNAGCVRQAWFWKRQVKCAIRGWGWSQYSSVELLNMLDQMSPHFDPYFYSQLFPDVDGLDEMNQILSARFCSSVQDQAKKHFFATLLNIVSGRLHTFQIVSRDGANASQAIQYMANLLTDGDPANDYSVILIAVNINCAWFDLPANVIDLELPQIAFKGENINSVPFAFELGQNFPNPFNPTTEINYSLPEAGDVRLDVFNITGQKVSTLINEYQDAGHYTVTWNSRDTHGSRVSSGIYFYRLSAGEYVESRKMVLMK